MWKSRLSKAVIALAAFLLASDGISAVTDQPGLSRQAPWQELVIGEAGVLPSSVAVTPECDLITFEGLANKASVGRVDGRVPVRFGTSWLSVIDEDAGGTGNFANEPSASTTAFFLDMDDISITFDSGVQSVEFWYTAAAQSLPIHVIAYDEAGNLVDDNTGSVVGTDYDGAPCAGDPEGDFCSFVRLNLESTSNNIRSIAILGTVSNYFAIDDVRYCTARCSAGSADSEVLEEISGFGTCGPEGPKTPTWGHFGPLPELVADSGEKLQVECGSGGNFLAFYLLYTAPGEPTRRIGMCPFEGGCNSAWFWHSGDSNNNGNPDCFVRTRWVSRDYSANDTWPNAWTGAYDEPLENLIPPIGDLLDWAESVFDANTGMLTKTDLKYRYEIDPPLPRGTCGGANAPEGNLFEKEVVKADILDPPIGPETEAFFDAVMDRLQSLPPGDPMSEDTTPKCDLNRDGRCDAQDQADFIANLGKCYWDVGYNPIADIDGNGCLTVADRQWLEVCRTLAMTVDPAGAGVIELDPVPNCGGGGYAVGADVQVRARSNPGWYFQGWTGEHTSTENPLSLNMAEDEAITAQFETWRRGMVATIVKFKYTRPRPLVALRGTITVKANGVGVADATVVGHWTRPDGSQQPQMVKTSSAGVAIVKTRGTTGTYVFTIDDLQKPRFGFDRERSALQASVTIGN